MHGATAGARQLTAPQALADTLAWIRRESGTLASSPHPSTTASRIPPCRHKRLVIAIDGPTGSGKSFLAHRLAAALSDGALSDAAVPHHMLEVDAVVPGWDGLARGVAACRAFVRDLDAHGDAHISTWDWDAMAPGLPGSDITADITTGGLCIIEGCGALASVAQALPCLLIRRLWVDAPPAIRYARIRERDSYSWDVDAWEAAEMSLRSWWLDKSAWFPDVVVHTCIPVSQPPCDLHLKADTGSG